MTYKPQTDWFTITICTMNYDHDTCKVKVLNFEAKVYENTGICKEVKAEATEHDDRNYYLENKLNKTLSPSVVNTKEREKSTNLKLSQFGNDDGNSSDVIQEKITEKRSLTKSRKPTSRQITLFPKYLKQFSTHITFHQGSKNKVEKLFTSKVNVHYNGEDPFGFQRSNNFVNQYVYHQSNMNMPVQERNVPSILKRKRIYKSDLRKPMKVNVVSFPKSKPRLFTTETYKIEKDSTDKLPSMNTSLNKSRSSISQKSMSLTDEEVDNKSSLSTHSSESEQNDDLDNKKHKSLENTEDSQTFNIISSKLNEFINPGIPCEKDHIYFRKPPHFGLFYILSFLRFTTLVLVFLIGAPILLMVFVCWLFTCPFKTNEELNKCSCLYERKADYSGVNLQTTMRRTQYINETFFSIFETVNNFLRGPIFPEIAGTPFRNEFMKRSCYFHEKEVSKIKKRKKSKQASEVIV